MAVATAQAMRLLLPVPDQIIRRVPEAGGDVEAEAVDVVTLKAVAAAAKGNNVAVVAKEEGRTQLWAPGLTVSPRKALRQVLGTRLKPQMITRPRRMARFASFAPIPSPTAPSHHVITSPATFVLCA